jgi:branched-subunit amino acid transport protein
MAAPFIWLTIVLAGVLTFLTRLSFFALMDRWEPPYLLKRGLRYVPPAVLSAIVFPELLIQNGALNLAPGNVRLLAGLVAILVGWRTRNVFLTIAAGMGAFYLLGLLLH